MAERKPADAPTTRTAVLKSSTGCALAIRGIAGKTAQTFKRAGRMVFGLYRPDQARRAAASRIGRATTQDRVALSATAPHAR
ncbi:hypothetical protein EXIGLDRAFT_718023 [Exidia glandulosa HHB12029]|uniref:Uncharacterized protein n=1 Tax=Exidia glandulosa HHB12029 TaxID=1314781 RepID=A0A166MKS2_EXIGL|nr:hypothetical protein EXIGLDRAFT_718023 [Exidia glandulosa HHB12029]